MKYIEVLKSKIHRAVVTEANLNYVGSITIDISLMEAAQLNQWERVQIVNINTGSRFDTYVIPGDRESGIICLNGGAARKVQKQDFIIILSYWTIDIEEVKKIKPILIFPDTNNLLTQKIK